MTSLSNETLGSVLFEFTWKSAAARHVDRFVAQKINLWRDVLPRDLHVGLNGMEEGDGLECAPAIPEPDPRLVHELPRRDFRPELVGMSDLRPLPGRFYPQGILRHVMGVHPSNTVPFRVLEADERSVLVDRNHPLAGVDVFMRATLLEVRDKAAELGGSCQDWLELALDGPGIQARRTDGKPTSFPLDTLLSRPDEAPDDVFHRTPRLVAHIDSKARERLALLHGELLRPGMDVLDLMAGVHSHLPADAAPASVTGLGMNREELDANPDLTARVVHDLNRDARLPFADASFDAVLCALSVEYLARPLEVLRDAVRVLRPGGVLAVSFSNRWHPSKAVELWSQLHEFERPGFVTELLLAAGFSDVQTLSERGWPRPYDARDRYYPVLQNADPLYAVQAVRP